MNARDLVGSGFEWCGVLFLVVVALPLVAAAFFVLRGVLLLAAIPALAGFGLLCWLRPDFRARVARAAGPRPPSDT